MAAMAAALQPLSLADLPLSLGLRCKGLMPSRDIRCAWSPATGMPLPATGGVQAEATGLREEDG